MLDRESERLDLKKVRLTKKTVEIDAQGMSSQFGVKTSAQPPKSVGMVGFDVELLSELTVDGFNDLTDGVDQAPRVSRHRRISCQFLSSIRPY